MILVCLTKLSTIARILKAKQKNNNATTIHNNIHIQRFYFYAILFRARKLYFERYFDNYLCNNF